MWLRRAEINTRKRTFNNKFNINNAKLNFTHLFNHKQSSLIPQLNLSHKLFHTLNIKNSKNTPLVTQITKRKCTQPLSSLLSLHNYSSPTSTLLLLSRRSFCLTNERRGESEPEIPQRKPNNIFSSFTSIFSRKSGPKDEEKEEIQKIMELYQDWLKTHRYVSIFGFNLSLALLFYLLLLIGFYHVMELSLHVLVLIGGLGQEYLTNYPEVIHNPSLDEKEELLLQIRDRNDRNDTRYETRNQTKFFGDRVDNYFTRASKQSNDSNNQEEGVLRISSICNDSRVAFQQTIFHLLGSISITYLYTNFYTKRKLTQFFNLYPHLFKNFPQPLPPESEAVYVVTKKPEVPIAVRKYIVHRHSLKSAFMVFGFTMCMSLLAQKAYFYYNSDNLPYSTIPFMLLMNSFPYIKNENPSVAGSSPDQYNQSRSRFPPPPLDDSSIQTSSFIPPESMPINIKNEKTIDWSANKKMRIIFKRNDWKDIILEQQDKLMNLFTHGGLALTSAVGIYLLAYPMPFLTPYLLTYFFATFMYPREKVIITDILYRPLNDPLGAVYAYHIDAQVMTIPEYYEFVAGGYGELGRGVGREIGLGEQEEDEFTFVPDENENENENEY